MSFHLSLWEQEFLISLSEICRVYKQGRKKTSWSINSFFPFEDVPLFSHPEVYFSFNNLWQYLFLSIFFVIYTNFTAYFTHYAVIKVCHISFPWLFDVFTKIRPVTGYLIRGGGVIFCFVYTECILLHSSISNAISLFILRFPNLTATNRCVRGLVYGYCFWKWNWKSEKAWFYFRFSCLIGCKRDWAWFKLMNHPCEVAECVGRVYGLCFSLSVV